MKQCICCKELLPLELFGWNNRKHTFRKPECRNCYATRNRRKYAENRTEILKRRDKRKCAKRVREYRARRPDVARTTRERYLGKLDAAKRLWQRARIRARIKGWDFTIQPDDLIVPEQCPILGIRLSFGGLGNRDSSPSIDRIDSKKGYVPGNVHVISFRANVLKRDATVEELEALAEYFRKLTSGGL